jgi:hypothetical protein
MAGRIKKAEAWTAVVLDMIWVMGSYGLLFAVSFSSGEKWAAALVAELVFVIWCSAVGTAEA